MKTYTLNTDQGECIGFEIQNNFFGSRSIARFIKRVPGCEVKSIRKIFAPSEIHTTFRYKDKEFIVWEPYGDNSRLHIGSEHNVNEKIIKNLEKDVALTRNYFF